MANASIIASIDAREEGTLRNHLNYSSISYLLSIAEIMMPLYEAFI